MEDDEEEDEVVDVEEFVRCALLRGINIRVTSSALMESIPSPLLLELHLGNGCKLGGDATAVIGMVFWECVYSIQFLALDVPNPLPREPRPRIPLL